MSKPTVVECSWPTERDWKATSQMYADAIAQIAATSLSASQMMRGASAVMKLAATNTTNFKL